MYHCREGGTGEVEEKSISLEWGERRREGERWRKLSRGVPLERREGERRGGGGGEQEQGKLRKGVH